MSAPSDPPRDDDGSPALFLDRDGTVIINRHYLADPAGVELLPGVVEGIALASSSGLQVVLVTNQSGVARGLMTEDDVTAVNARLVELLAAQGATLDAMYFCPHHPTAGIVERFARACECRKPAPGMILRAAADLGLDLQRSALVGDSDDDMGAAAAAGIPGLRIGDADHATVLEAVQALLCGQSTPEGSP